MVSGMNNKDYKAIAGILKLIQNSRTDHFTITTKLADYFERQKKKLNVTFASVSRKRILNFMGDELQCFDKEQFLKDCGVEDLK